MTAKSPATLADKAAWAHAAHAGSVPRLRGAAQRHAASDAGARPGQRVVCANFPAEVFFGASVNVLRRRSAEDLVAFSCPLLALIRQVRQTHATVNEYGVDLTMPDGEGPGGRRFCRARSSIMTGIVMVMLQQRTMAQMIERQLTHRGAARSVSGLAAVLAHEIKNPLSGIRGAAQLLESGASA